jgi:hypothetical protein
MTNSTRRGEGSASRRGRSLPPGKTRYALYRRLGGSQGRSGQVRKISPPPGFDPRTAQPVASRYTDWAIPAHPINIYWPLISELVFLDWLVSYWLIKSFPSTLWNVNFIYVIHLLVLPYRKHTAFPWQTSIDFSEKYLLFILRIIKKTKDTFSEGTQESFYFKVCGNVLETAKDRPLHLLCLPNSFIH